MERHDFKLIGEKGAVFQGKVLFLDRMLVIVPASGTENGPGIAVSVEGGHLVGRELTVEPVTVEPLVPEDPTPIPPNPVPAEEVPPATPPAAVEATAASTEN